MKAYRVILMLLLVIIWVGQRNNKIYSRVKNDCKWLWKNMDKKKRGLEIRITVRLILKKKSK